MEVKTINGYDIKDETARNKIDLMNSKVEYIFPKFISNATSGDSSLIKYRNKSILIDTYGLDQWLEIKAMLDDNNVNHIDYLIITHYHQDHYGNFKNLVENNYVNNKTKLYMPSNLVQVSSVNTIIQEYTNYCEQHNLTYYVPLENEVLTIDDLKLTFYNTDSSILYQEYYVGHTTPDYNNTSTIVLVEHKNVKSFYSGDSSNLAYNRFYDDKFIKGEVDLFKVGHHGINHATNENFIKLLNPKYAVVTSGIADFKINNQSDCEEVAILQKLGCKIYPCHMESDYIKFISDGSSMKCISGIPYDLSKGAIWKSIYVNSNVNLNEIQDGTQEHPFSNLNSALDVIDKTTNYHIDIYLSDGDYNVLDDDLANNNKRKTVFNTGSNRIRVHGNTEDRTKVKLSQTLIKYSTVTLENLTINLDTYNDTAGLYIENSNVILNNVLIDSVENNLINCNAIGIGDQSQLWINGNSRINNCNRCISGADSTIFINNLSIGNFSNSEAISLYRCFYASEIISFDNEEKRLAFNKRNKLFNSPQAIFSGDTHPEITLSKSATNYDWIELFYRDVNNNYGSMKIYNPNNKIVAITICHVASAMDSLYNTTHRLKILNDKISLVNSVKWHVVNNQTVFTADANEIYILKVVGGFNNREDYTVS